MILFRPDTMNPKKKSRKESETWVRKAKSLESVKPKPEATSTAKKDTGDLLL